MLSAMSRQRYLIRGRRLNAHWLSAQLAIKIDFSCVPSRLPSWKRLNAAHDSPEFAFGIHSTIFCRALQLLLKFNLLDENRS
jgi:hypothetical protein